MLVLVRVPVPSRTPVCGRSQVVLGANVVEVEGRGGVVVERRARLVRDLVVSSGGDPIAYDPKVVGVHVQRPVPVDERALFLVAGADARHELRWIRSNPRTEVVEEALGRAIVFAPARVDDDSQELMRAGAPAKLLDRHHAGRLTREQLLKVALKVA